MRYGHIPYHVLRGNEPLTDMDRAIVLREIEGFLQQEYASNPSRGES